MQLVPEKLLSAYQEPITRADFCLLMTTFIEARAARTMNQILAERGLEVTSGVFTDAKESYILQMNALDIVKGLGDGTFSPKAYITRQEAAVMIWRMAEQFGFQSAEQPPKVFADADTIAAWAGDGVAYVTSLYAPNVGTEVMAGMGNGDFAPLGTYTREQSILVVNRLADATTYPGAGGTLLQALALIAPDGEREGAELSFFTPKAKRYIFQRSDGYAILHDVDEEGVYVEEYGSEGRALGYKKLAAELPVFGGAYRASDGDYYLAYGQENKEENPNKEVIRLVRYSPDWQRLGAAPITAGPSIIRIPFSFGTVSMTDQAGILTIHTTRERFTSDDGANHQSNLTIQVEIPAMRMVFQSEAFSQNPVKNYVSHSLAQFVRHDGGLTVYVENGDAYPRSLYLQTLDSQGNRERTHLLTPPGQVGDNTTGITPGGFEVTGSHYMVTVSAVDMNSYNDGRGPRNVSVLTVPRSQLSSIAANEQNTVNEQNIVRGTSGSAVRVTSNNTARVTSDNAATVTVTPLTSFPASGTATAGSPYLVKIRDNQFVVLWEEYADKVYQATKYAVLDASGALVGSVRETSMRLPGNTQPVYNEHENKIIWPYIWKKGGLTRRYLCELTMSS
jgi:hypothetical protein